MTTDSGRDLSKVLTPEVAAYWGTLDAQKAILRPVRRRVLAMVALFLAAALTVIIIGAIKVDAKFSSIEQTVTTIRTSQVANSIASVSRSNCQDKDFNAILKAAQLAFSGDRNAADYPRVKKC